MCCVCAQPHQQLFMECLDRHWLVQSPDLSLSCAWLQLLLSHGHGDRVSNDPGLPPIHADCFITCYVRSFQNLGQSRTSETLLLVSPRESWRGLGADRELCRRGQLLLGLSVLPGPAGRWVLCHLREGIYAAEGEQKPAASPFASSVFVSFPKLVSLTTRVCWNPSFLGCGQLALVSSAF